MLPLAGDRAVGFDVDFEILFAKCLQEFVDTRMEQRLTTGEGDAFYAAFGAVCFYSVYDFGNTHLLVVVSFDGVHGIAIAATQVAAVESHKYSGLTGT